MSAKYFILRSKYDGNYSIRLADRKDINQNEYDILDHVKTMDDAKISLTLIIEDEISRLANNLEYTMDNKQQTTG